LLNGFNTINRENSEAQDSNLAELPRLVSSLVTTVSAALMLAREHISSDVIVGSTMGYLIGGLVLHHRAAGMGGLSLNSIRTANARGLQISCEFRR
jgi:hypothetical protein